jgi:hypothetical protein
MFPPSAHLAGSLLLLIAVALLTGGCKFSEGMAWENDEWLRRLEEQPGPIQRQIVASTVDTGMTKEQALLSWGRPREVKPHDLHDEEWVYGSSSANTNTFLYFDGGKLVEAVKGDNRLFRSDKPLAFPVEAPFRLPGGREESETREFSLSPNDVLDLAEQAGFVVRRNSQKLADKEDGNNPHLRASLKGDASRTTVVAEGNVRARTRLWFVLEDRFKDRPEDE